MNTALKIFDFVWPLLAVGGGLTLFTQIAKRIARVEKSSVARFMFHSFTLLFTFATWWVDHAMGLYMLVLHGGAYSGFASGLYPVVKWLDGKVTKFMNVVKLVKQYEPALEKVGLAVETSTGVSLAPPADPPQPDTTVHNANNKPAAADF